MKWYPTLDQVMDNRHGCIIETKLALCIFCIISYRLNETLNKQKFRETTGLTTENSELKLCLQTMKQQVHLQDGNIHPTLMIDGFYLAQHFIY